MRRIGICPASASCAGCAAPLGGRAGAGSAGQGLAERLPRRFSLVASPQSGDRSARFDGACGQRRCRFRRSEKFRETRYRHCDSLELLYECRSDSGRAAAVYLTALTKSAPRCSAHGTGARRLRQGRRRPRFGLTAMEPALSASRPTLQAHALRGGSCGAAARRATRDFPLSTDSPILWGQAMHNRRSSHATVRKSGAAGVD